MDRYTESFAVELEQFTEAVLGGKPTPVTGIDSRMPVVMAIAARKSYRRAPASEIDGGGSLKRSKSMVCILTDVHLWVPVVVLILGTALLMTLR